MAGDAGGSCGAKVVQHVGWRGMRVVQHRIPQARVVARRAVQRGDEVGGALVIQDCSGDAQLLHAVMAGCAGANRLAVVKLVGRNRPPSCIDMAAFASVGGVQVGGVFAGDGLHRGLVGTVMAGEACAQCLGVIEDHHRRPRPAARGVASIAVVGGVHMGGRLVRDHSARKAELRSAIVTKHASARRLSVINLQRRHIPIGRRLVTAFAIGAGGDVLG